MRLFIAVNFSDETKNRILKIQEQLRSQAYKGSFSRPENFHLTLAFLGETPEEKLQVLSGIMGEARSKQPFGIAPFDLLFNRTGCFTHSRKELWWLGADRNCPGLPLLEAIHGQLLDSLEKEGFPVDKRPFNAHVTLAREIKRANPIVLDCPAITVRVDRISMMKSERIKGVLTYTELFGRQLDVL